MISKKGWYALAFLVVLIFLFTLYGNEAWGTARFPVTDSAWDSLNTIYGKISGLAVSNVVVYGFVVLALFTWIQVVFLKHYFEKRIA